MCEQIYMATFQHVLLCRDYKYLIDLLTPTKIRRADGPTFLFKIIGAKFK